jgi:hypothetical protein
LECREASAFGEAKLSICPSLFGKNELVAIVSLLETLAKRHSGASTVSMQPNLSRLNEPDSKRIVSLGLSSAVSEEETSAPSIERERALEREWRFSRVSWVHEKREKRERKSGERARGAVIL